MKTNSLSALIVTSEDSFLNEYVDNDFSPRVYLTGFTGTAGVLLVTEVSAHLMVDGRYHVQAEQQTDPDLFTVEKVGVDEQGNRTDEFIVDRLAALIRKFSEHKNYIVGYDPYQMGIRALEYLKKKVSAGYNTVVFTPLYNSLEQELLDAISQKPVQVYNIPKGINGFSCKDVVQNLQQKLIEANLNAFFVSKLDELAYISNLRAHEIPYNSTFKGYAFITTRDAFIYTDMKKFGCKNLIDLNQAFELIDIKDMFESLYAYMNRQKGKYFIGYDPSSMSCANLDKLNRLVTQDFKLLPLDSSPINNMKAIKTNQELEYMQACFIRADNVFNDVINWTNAKIKAGSTVTEFNLKNMVKETFEKYGASYLSFETICATAENGAIIHYTQSSDRKEIQPVDLVLLDCGGYFEAGYATDLTRTFLAGAEAAQADDKQKGIYTIVLRAAIKGLTAEIPPGENGVYLDKLVRDVVNNYHYDYIHGTGHGVGILVHEAPPRINAGFTGQAVLKENMVFSIEPGLYFEGWGGVRIENLVKLVKHSDQAKAANGWLQVECMTYAPLDENLINYDMLQEWEKEFLEAYKTRFQKINAG